VEKTGRTYALLSSALLCCVPLALRSTFRLSSTAFDLAATAGTLRSVSVFVCTGRPAANRVRFDCVAHHDAAAIRLTLQQCATKQASKQGRKEARKQASKVTTTQQHRLNVIHGQAFRLSSSLVYLVLSFLVLSCFKSNPTDTK
jgi:hypothetical protein